MQILYRREATQCVLMWIMCEILSIYSLGKLSIVEKYMEISFLCELCENCLLMWRLYENCTHVKTTRILIGVTCMWFVYRFENYVNWASMGQLRELWMDETVIRPLYRSKILCLLCINLKQRELCIAVKNLLIAYRC